MPDIAPLPLQSSLSQSLPSRDNRNPETSVEEIRVAHSPDSDDAFMFYGLATGKIRVPGLRFTHTLTDIETLNHQAIADAPFDITAISFHAYPYLQERYALMAAGSSFGEGYGPMLVAARKYSLAEIPRLRIAIPGTLTTAYLTLKLFCPTVETVAVDFDKIIPAVLAGEYDAGLLIHEGQLTYAHDGLAKILDLGQWWRDLTGLPLPLGGNAIRRSLGPETMQRTAAAVRDSIQHALDNREPALQYAMQFARDLDPSLANRYIGMYVNERTLDMGEDGREAIRRILALGHERGIIPLASKVDFIA